MEYFELLKKYPDLLRDQKGLLKIVLDQTTIKRWQTHRIKTLHKNQQPSSWADIGIVLDDPYFLIIRDLVEFPDGEMRGYSRLINQANLENGKGVVVLPEYQGKILLLHQFRHPTRGWHYEFPRGYGEPNVTAHENARKEIEEETGGIITKLVDLGEFYNNTGFEGCAVSLFYAKLSSIGKPNLNEGIDSYLWVTVDEIEQWITNGKITDGFTIAAYTKSKLMHLI